MAATPKPVRKESKLMGKSIRKSHPISLTNAPKQIINKRSKYVSKLNSKLEKKHK